MIFQAGGTPLERTRRILVKSTVFAVVLAAIAAILFVLVARFDVATLIFHPERLVSTGADRAEVVRLFALFDLLGYYLAFGVVVLAVRGLFWARGPAKMNWMALAGLAYVVIGGFGALMLAALAPNLIKEFAATTGPRQAAASVSFAHLTDQIFGLAWRGLTSIAAAIWWVGIAMLVGRTLPVVRALAWIVAGTALASSITYWVGLPSASSVLTFAWVLLWLPALFLLGRSFRGVDFDVEQGLPSED